MKVPMSPPPVDALLASLLEEPDTDKISRIFRLGSSSREGSEYLPWEKIRFKTPPDGLSPEEWWLSIRLSRRSAARAIPSLIDTSGTPFSFALPDVVLKEVDYLTRSASGAITASEQVTNPATRDRYVVSSLIEEAITSSQLEGAVTSRRVAKEMIRSGRPPIDRSERMILNNYEAMRLITELRDEALSPEIICQIHRTVTDGTLDNPESAGIIQSDDKERVAVWGDGDQLLHRPPGVAELDDRMRRLCAFANGADGSPYMSGALRAITIHFMMGYDHYFEDGNGRTARALFYWSMLREGFWLTEFITISKILKKAHAAYSRSFLLTEQDDNDLTHFFVYQLDVIHRAIDELHHYLARKGQELVEVQRSIKATPGEYNHRQLALLEHALRQPSSQYSALSHSRSHNVSAETARQDLMDLDRRQILRRHKVGKRFVWVAVDGLAERLKGPQS